MKIFKPIDDLLNSLTMYKAVAYGLSVLAFVAILFSYTGVLTFSASALALSLSTLLVVCYATNWILAKVWRAMPSVESSLITALILFFLLPPTNTASRFIGLIGVGIAAMASKYMLAYRRKHIFNPAAIGLTIGSLLGISSAIWWVGNKSMYLLVLFVGLLIARKVRHFNMVMVFFAVHLTMIALLNLDSASGWQDAVRLAITSSPLIFLGTIMLTEPATVPSTKKWQYLYAVFVAALTAVNIRLFDRSITAEMVLVIANLGAFVVSPKFKTILTYAGSAPVQPGSNIYDFRFDSSDKLNHRAGQYLELTLPHHGTDIRGNRRVFTIASSPTEDQVHFGIRINTETMSSFKSSLINLEPGHKLVGGQLAGSFTLPKKPNKKLLFVAGGIGVTPFRSMAKYMIDIGQNRDIIMLYILSRPEDLAYKAEFTEAANLGFKTLPVLTSQQIPADWAGAKGPLDSETISKLVPDVSDRQAFISGPPGMVDSYKTMLKKAGIKKVTTDHFSGY